MAQAGLWWAGLPAEGHGSTEFAWRAALLFALQVLSAWIAWRRHDRAAVAAVLCAGLAFRLAALAWSPDLSSDVYRYVWDGRVQLAGYSPYDFPPKDDALSSLRDQAIWPNINRPEAITVYPPGAQALFASLAAAGATSVRRIRIAALAAELVALALVVLLCLRRRLSAGRLLLYAWSPLVIAEVCVSGHLDAWVLPCVVLTVWTAQTRPRLSGALIGIASLMKIYPLLLLAAIPSSARVRAAAVAVLVIAMGYVPYAAVSGVDVLGFLPDYARSGEDFNPALRGFLETALLWSGSHARTISMGLTAVALMVALAWIASALPADPFVRARRASLAFILLLPTAVHPWYALFLVPLVVIDFSPAAMWMVGMLPLSYLKYSEEQMPLWVPWVEWLPVVALLGYAVWDARRARAIA